MPPHAVPSPGSETPPAGADPRRDALAAWLAGLPEGPTLSLGTLRTASNDASFRRYFRVDADAGRTWIAMDAPPPQEDVRPFVAVARLFAGAGVSVPRVAQADVARGFLLLEDFGDTTYLSVLDADRADALYRDAIDALVRLQAAIRAGELPAYDAGLLEREMRLFPEWYVARHVQRPLPDDDRQMLERTFGTLAACALGQPRVWVHRDYHSRNLMRLDGAANPGILDFQDAVHGPVTYDLVSLLRDAYVEWDEERVIDWTVRYWEAARRAGLPVADDFGEFYRDFEWMGLQRHLKVLGIFARLAYRDGKQRYLGDLPRVLRYVRAVAGRYGAFGPLLALLDRLEDRPTGTGYTF